MGYKITYTSKYGDGERVAKTLDNARITAQLLRKNGFENILIHDEETKRPLGFIDGQSALKPAC